MCCGWLLPASMTLAGRSAKSPLGADASQLRLMNDLYQAASPNRISSLNCSISACSRQAAAALRGLAAAGVGRACAWKGDDGEHFVGWRQLLQNDLAPQAGSRRPCIAGGERDRRDHFARSGPARRRAAGLGYFVALALFLSRAPPARWRTSRLGRCADVAGLYWPAGARTN
jgi:hypothetical protein